MTVMVLAENDDDDDDDGGAGDNQNDNDHGDHDSCDNDNDDYDSQKFELCDSVSPTCRLPLQEICRVTLGSFAAFLCKSCLLASQFGVVSGCALL
jgi:hypothetical protein